MDKEFKELAKWAPFREASQLRDEIDRLWQDFLASGRAIRSMGEQWIPPVDILDTADKVTVKVEVPGLDIKNIEISLSRDVLTIKGEKKTERDEKGKNFFLSERSYGSFSRSLRLPVEVEEDKIEATYKHGVLTITCPKKEVIKSKQIIIKSE
jgi:HSP20 family protein